MNDFILRALSRHFTYISFSPTWLQQENPHYQSHKTNVYMGIEKANQAGHTLVKHLLFCSKSELLDLILVGTGHSVISMAIRIMSITAAIATKYLMLILENNIALNNKAKKVVWLCM